VYYFRAMAYMQLGRVEEAEADMVVGSQLEMEDAAGYYPVGRSLERVQGPGRALLERHRVKARLAVLQRRKEIERQRYEAVQRREEGVLRQQIVVPVAGGEPTVQPATVEAPADPQQPMPQPAAAPDNDPFGTPAPAP